jgi:hypothetical protein
LRIPLKAIGYPGRKPITAETNRAQERSEGWIPKAESFGSWTLVEDGVWGSGLCYPDSILGRGLFETIDHEYLDWRLAMFQLQPKFL